MKKLVLTVLCAATMTSMAACGAKEPVTAETVKTETRITAVAATPESIEPEEPIGMPNPWTDYKTLKEAEDAAGYSFSVPESIGEYKQTIIQAMGQEIIQVFFETGEQSDAVILIRKGTGSDDISGDFNTYKETEQVDINGYQVTEQGNDGQVMLATWTDAGYTYSVSTPGLSESEMESIIKQVK